MPSAPADLEAAEELIADRPDLKEVLWRSLVKGVAVLLPLVVTLFVVSFVLGFVFDQLAPLVGAVVGTGVTDSKALVTAITLALFLGIILVIGFTAEFTPGNHRLNDQFDEFMSSIPGIGSVYTSFNEMTELLLDSDTDSFQDVKLVEYPGEDSYVVAFKTAETPEVIARDTGNDDMITLFMPMAPNPVMGGFVIHVSRERVVDVDLTVEEGIRSIVTSGVAIGSDEGTMTAVGEERLQNLGDLDDHATVAGVDGTPAPNLGGESTGEEELDVEPESDQESARDDDRDGGER